METIQKIKSRPSKYAFVNGEKSATEINMKGVKDFTKKLTNDKKAMLENSFEEIKKLTNELEYLKLQNEEMEITIGDATNEKEQLEDSLRLVNNSYDTLLKQYTETKKLLHDSHDQNIQLSEILEKMRENEKCLIFETQKLRKFGSLHESNNNQHGRVKLDTIANLEKEVKFWQLESQKLSEIIELNDKKLQFSASKKTISMKKKPNEMKRYNKVVNRSHSVETSQRKSKELEFEKLKTEKIQMKNLLNDLERQVFEIQNNVVKISDERQKYKDFFFSTKEKLERNENVNVNLERKNVDSTNENSKLSRENHKLMKEVNVMLQDNDQLKQENENLHKEISNIKIQHGHEIKALESKLSSFAKENHDIGVRSNNLKNSIISLESDFKEMEQELRRKCEQSKESSDTICLLQNEFANCKHQFEEKSKNLNEANEKLDALLENIRKIRKSEEVLTEKLEIKTKETNVSRGKEKEKEEIMQNMKSSFSAHTVKLENRLQNAEQIISSKIKLITSLELKISNNEKELKSKEDEMLQLKKTLNSREHELEIITHKYNEISEGKKYLEQHVENLSSEHKVVNCEVNSLSQMIKEMTQADELSRTEIRSLKETLHRKEDQMLIMETKLIRFEKELPIKIEEVNKSKKIISQLENVIDHKESHIGSVLSILEGKEEKILSFQSSNEENERKIKEYMDQLNNIDDCVIQSTARNNALEKEIEDLQNNNIRLGRQKEHLGQMLSERNKAIGQLQAQLADQNEGRYLEKISIIDDFPGPENIKNYDETKIQRKSRVDMRKQKNENITNPNQNYQAQSNYIQKHAISDNYDQGAIRNRAQSHNGRSICLINAM